jgi:hypothetical protein
MAEAAGKLNLVFRVLFRARRAPERGGRARLKDS